MRPIRHASSIVESYLRGPRQTSTSSPGRLSTAPAATPICPSRCRRPLLPQPKFNRKDKAAIWQTRRWPTASHSPPKTQTGSTRHNQTLSRIRLAFSSVLETPAYSALLLRSQVTWCTRVVPRLAQSVLLTCAQRLTLNK